MTNESVACIYLYKCTLCDTKTRERLCIFNRPPARMAMAFKMATTGMCVAEECKNSFMEMKWKKVHRYIVFKIDERSRAVMVDKVGGPGEGYDDLTASLPDDDCRYAVFDFDFVTVDKCQKSKIFFIAWFGFDPRNHRPIFKHKSRAEAPPLLTSNSGVISYLVGRAGSPRKGKECVLCLVLEAVVSFSTVMFAVCSSSVLSFYINTHFLVVYASGSTGFKNKSQDAVCNFQGRIEASVGWSAL
ncbi:actin-binding proteins ADF [Asimina triloba]